MSTKKELEDKKDYARLLYMQGEQQKTIAEKAGVSPQTVTKWVNTGNWSEQRAAQNITRPELVNKLLRTVDKMIEAVHTRGQRLGRQAGKVRRYNRKARQAHQHRGCYRGVYGFR